jgi:cytochrome b subunit of formate dehydrogenase
MSMGRSAGPPASQYRALATAMILKILYWLAVLAVSLALVIGLILFFESRDQSSIEGADARPFLTSA